MEVSNVEGNRLGRPSGALWGAMLGGTILAFTTILSFGSGGRLDVPDIGLNLSIHRSVENDRSFPIFFYYAFVLFSLQY